ncbi:innexin inx2-like [Sitophilus oryzae]|uniref:Innexin n=1 Tax=Sitophilus oryzae TaxID=7048 RepID=A0A6J2X1Z6_SITOR|nr:innexin inx2-like [Sitophilus oryzae]
MQEILKHLSSLVKGFDDHTDNNVFKLHYKFSVILLIVFSILLSSKQYFGDPIVCETAKDKELIKVYCWITGTFIQKKNIDAAAQYESLYGLGNTVYSRSETFTLFYYQWICFLFCFQALLFYLPRYFWTTWEGDRLGQLPKDLRDTLVPDNWIATGQKLCSYVCDAGNHDIMAFRFAFCELLNLCNLILQIMIMDWYLNGKFASYGYHVATKPYPHPMNEAFPKRTKCLYTNYGSSGSTQVMDALCVLPLNILNEKFFLILWYWMIILFFVTLIALIYRAMFMVWERFRIYLLMAQVRNLNRNKAVYITKHLTHGQFFLLYNLGKKLNPIVYKDLLLLIFEKMSEKYKFDI